MPPIPPSPALRRLSTALAWILILALTAWEIGKQAEHVDRASFAGVETELVARFDVGVRSLARSSDAFDVEATAVPSPAHQQRMAILDGDRRGAAPAHARLVASDEEAEAAGGDVVATHRILHRLYPSDGDAAPASDRVGRLTPDERALLVKQLGWFGELALAPADGDAEARASVIGAARRTAIAGICFVFALLVAVPVGIVLWIVAMVKGLRGTLKFAHEAPAGQRSFGAETYAAYLGSFALISLAWADIDWGGARWLAVFAFDVVTLGVLALPVILGVPWTDYRRRIGLHRGRGLLREAGAGIIATLLTLPVVLAGAFVSAMLQRAAGHVEAPGEGGHPVIAFFGTASAADLAMLFVLMAVTAPLCEETLFRGVLFGHLRETTSRLPRWFSVLVAAGVSGVLFAVVHPQGWTQVPAIASLGFTFGLVREWRGSLAATMTAHGLWNGSIFLFAWMALGR